MWSGTISNGFIAEISTLLTIEREMTLSSADVLYIAISKFNAKRLKVEPVDENLSRYKSNWLRHVARMNSSRMAK